MKTFKIVFIFLTLITLKVSAQSDTALDDNRGRSRGHYDSNNNNNNSTGTDYDNYPQTKGFSWDNAFSGGSFGLTFGSVTDIQLDPELGYRFGKYFYLGIGVDYEYYKYTDPSVNYSTSAQLIGGNIFARYVVYKNIFAEMQVKAINWDAPQFDYLTQSLTFQNVTVPAFNIGVGYLEPIGQRSAIYIVVLYDLIYGNNSPAPSPLGVDFGINFGL